MHGIINDGVVFSSRLFIFHRKWDEDTVTCTQLNGIHFDIDFVINESAVSVDSVYAHTHTATNII